MMTIDQLITPVTTAQIFNQMITWMVTAGLPADKWRNGGVGRSIIYAIAVAYTTLAGLITLLAQSGFLTTATDDALTLLAYYVYGVTRVVATFATGQVQASNASGSIYTFNPGEFVVQSSVTMKSYANTSMFTLNPGDMNIDVDVQALEQGTASNAAIGDVTLLGRALDGVTVTNNAAILGVDAWTDPQLRSACLAKLGALSMMGPRGAYQYAIMSALNNGVPVNVNRWAISESSSTGIVTVALASPSGPVTTSDLDAVDANIEAVARPDSVTADVENTTTVSYAKTLTVWAIANKGVDADTIRSEVIAQLEAYEEVYPIGGIIKTGSQGYMYDESIRGIAQKADAAIFAVDSDDGLDLAIAALQTAIITSTINVRLITTPVTS